jgi:penicillin-binding protein activator
MQIQSGTWGLDTTRDRFAWICVAMALLASCAGTTVTRDPNVKAPTEGDLSGYWNDIDAQMVAKAMIEQCLGNPWVSQFQETHGGERPVVKLMGVLKRTDDRNINENYFAKQLERELLNSGRVRVVAAYGQEGVNTQERARQAVHANDETAKSQKNEVGADFTLQTIVNSQNDRDGEGMWVRAYLVNMELVDVEGNEKVWIGEQQIRKIVDQPAAKW